MLEERIIALSKKKNFLIMLASIALVALGAWLFSLDAHTIEAQRRYNSPWLVHGLGLVLIVSFALIGLFSAKQMFNKAPGLVINEDGILDNSSALSAGFVPWEDIAAIGETEIQKQRTVAILVNDPKKYASRGNVIQRLFKQANLKLAGSSVNISANSLAMSHDDLLTTIINYHQHSHHQQGADQDQQDILLETTYTG